MFFLELPQEHVVYFRVMVGKILQSSCLFSDVMTPVYLQGHLRNLHDAWQGNTDTSQGEAGDPGYLSSCNSDIRIPINFQQVLGIATFLSIEIPSLLRCQKDVRPPVQMRQGPRAFSRVSTVDAHIPSSCEMNDEPSSNSLQGNPAFFQVRASWCPFHLRQQTKGPSHIPTVEGRLF